jgi:hypothetical protein
MESDDVQNKNDVRICFGAPFDFRLLSPYEKRKGN